MKRLKMLGCLSFLWVVAFISMVQCAAMGKNSNGVNSTVFLEEDDEDFVPYQGERFSVFDWMLFRTMAKRYSGNVLISPISIKMALVLLYEGAQDQTAHELANVMQLPASRPATRDKFTGILRSLQKPSSEYALDTSTRIYVDNNITTRQRYAAIVKSFYGTDLVHVNLSDTHLVSEKVNSWVKNVTRERITKLIENEESLKDSVMLIVNALFFKGTWRRHIFSPNNTHIRKFYTGKSESLDVPFMNVITRLYYSECPELDARILRLPYEGHKFAMYILLPNTLDGVDLLIKRVNPFLLVRYTWLMQDLPVEVSIPKFKFDYSSHLEPSLRELGIRDIFDDTATLTGIARTKRASKHLIVSDVIQKTGVEVNEQGTTAYAASGIQIGNKIVEQTFIADHPFVFFIEDESTGTILYTGKISNPLQREGSTGDVKVDLASRFSEETTVPTSGNNLRNKV